MESEANDLVGRARNGDRAAAEKLISLFYERVFAFLRRLAGSDEDAADLTQQTFARMWRSLDRFEGRSSVSSWIHGIARHVYLDWRRADRPGESRSDEWWNCEATGGPGPDASAEQSDLRSVLYAAVERLEEEVRETIHLHHYQGLTLQETADALGVATSTVKYRLRQAIAELKKDLNRQPTVAVEKKKQ